ncbi:MAG: hypothetical protein JOZ90_03920 [Alphaproteobacteria bacterium]|nr:hypothetical protein [Alphaproteobacteria bacterium]
MEDAAKPAVPAWFWIVAVLALLWEGMGCFSYLAQTGMMGAKLGEMPAEQAEVWRATPVWVWCAFAVAVWVGLAGAVLLLLRHRLARAAFAVSLLAAILQFGWAYTAGGAARTGAGGAVLPICIIAAGAFLVWFAGHGIRRGWLR